ncbi:MAG TPA: cytochrome C [Persephonella sp.]|uniref:Cytochrome c, class I n=1 Tax=Persephonella marina (strain DSM 14350 / EX-H1) TaxID=123214 RepID=C0QTT5_PERMH|nr:MULTISPECIES: cytochrome D1 domain-containing protein [Persephonella]ACO02987.1 cytochrome c, class I [Persephonella marina EX-H1]HCB70282.1 cytochrome C [Persephonella sp.]
MRRWLLLLLFGLSVVATSYPQEVGEGQLLYQTHCASCHGEDRAGKVAPPLFSLFLKRYSEKKLFNIIKNGLPASQMPAFSHLSEKEIKQIITYIKKPANISWDIDKIKKSITLNSDKKGKDLKIRDIKNIVAVVERGKNKVWIMEGLQILDKFDFKNVHGGLKFSPSGWSVYVPSRDGWIGRYDIDKGRFYGKVRACVYLRNISLDRTGKYILVSCWLPEGIVVLDGETFSPVRYIKQDGLISAIYELYSEDKAVFSFKNRPVIGFLDTKNFKISYLKIKEPYEDFFIDPFERFIIGTSRKGTVLSVYDIRKEKEVFNYPIEGMPHLASATYWYRDGKFYFATPHMIMPYVTVWQMYNWKFVKKVNTEGNGFFVRTHPSTPYLWTDNGKDKVILIDKTDYSVKSIETFKGKRVIHTEFSGDGKYAYVSLYNRDGNLLIYDSITLDLLKNIPASIPIGKYNIINKSRKYAPVLLGREVFLKKCWGCHHETQEAFAPSFRWIVNRRDRSTIVAHILNPEGMYKALGYSRNAMPQLNLSEWELEAVVSYMMEFKDAQNN